MCGILGFNGKLPADETKIKWLASMNESRGKDSTGFFTVGLDKDKTETLIKDVDKATKFIKRFDVTTAIKGSGLVIGHTRGASWGAVSKPNAHPFEKNTKTRVVGVHNGFVIQEVANSKWVGDGKLFPKSFDVDSEMIFALLSEYDGDPSILSEIEGAITIAYTVPDKYPGITHLYARTARTLHFARAKEGIYFSSEEEPLELIGCPEVLKVGDNTLVLLKDGEIYDIKVLDAPKIKSIPLDARRHNWAEKVGKDELNLYEEIKPKIYNTDQCDIDYGRSWNNRFPVLASKQKDYKQTSKESDEDIRGMLVKEVIDDLALIVPQPIPDFVSQDSYSGGDFDCCIVLIKLENSVDDRGLPGWLVFAKNNPDNACITALNGVGPLKFNPAYCGVEQTLVIKDPVDGQTIFTKAITPTNGRIMEVVLQLPFQKENPQGVATDADGFDSSLRKAIIAAGAPVIDILPPLTELHASNRGSEDSSEGSLSNKKEHVHFGHTEEQISGTEGREDENSRSIYNIGNSAQRDVFIPWTSLGLTFIDAVTIIKSENKTFTYDKAIKSLIRTPEYSFCLTSISKALPGLLNVGKLAHDAATLKIHFQEKQNASFAVLRYAAFLLERARKNYILATKIGGLTPAEDGNIVNFANNLCLGKLPQPDNKKKLILTESFTPECWNNQPNVNLDPALKKLIEERLN